MSSGASDHLDRLADDLPTTRRDVEALRRLRGAPVEGALRHPNRLSPPAFGLRRPAPRRTFEGCEELEL